MPYSVLSANVTVYYDASFVTVSREKSLLSSLVSGIVEPILDSMMDYVVDPILNAVLPLLQKFIGWFVDALTKFFPDLNPESALFSLIARISQIATTLKSDVTDFAHDIESLVELGMRKVAGFFQKGSSMMQDVIRNLSHIVVDLYDIINSSITNVEAMLTDAMTDGRTITRAIGRVVSTAETTITRAVSGIIAQTTSAMSTLITNAYNDIDSVALTIRTFAQNMVEYVKNAFETAFDEVKNLVLDAETKAEAGARDAINGLEIVAQSIGGQVVQFTRSVERYGMDLVNDVRKIPDDVRTGAQYVIDDAKLAAQALDKSFKLFAHVFRICVIIVLFIILLIFVVRSRK